MLERFGLGGCIYDIAALSLVLLMAAVIVIHNYRFRKECDSYDQL